MISYSSKIIIPGATEILVLILYYSDHGNTCYLETNRLFNCLPSLLILFFYRLMRPIIWVAIFGECSITRAKFYGDILRKRPAGANIFIGIMNNAVDPYGSRRSISSSTPVI